MDKQEAIVIETIKLFVDLLFEWARTCHHQGSFNKAINKYNDIWQIIGIDLAGCHDNYFCENRIVTHENIGCTLSAQGNYSSSLEYYHKAWNFLNNDLANTGNFSLNMKRFNMLVNSAVVLNAQGNFLEASEEISHAYEILSDLDKYIKAYHDHANALEEQERLLSRLREQNAQLIEHLKKHGKQPIEQEGYDKKHLEQKREIVRSKKNHATFFETYVLPRARARILLVWAVIKDNNILALKKLNQAWQIVGVNLAKVRAFDIDRALVLSSLGDVLQDLGNHIEAIDKYSQSYQILELGIDLADRSDLDYHRVAVLMNWAESLLRTKKFDDAIKTFTQAWHLLGSDLDERPDLNNIRAHLLKNWGDFFSEQNDYISAVKKYKSAWAIYTNKLYDRRDVDMITFLLVINWQNCWSTMDNPHDWAQKISNELRQRLDIQPPVDGADWINELWQRFTQFHLQWALNSLEDNRPELIINILSRVSNWRMVQTLLDELERKDSDELSPELQDYCKLRLKLANLQKVLQEKELVINPHNEGLRISSIQSGEPSDELRQEIAALRQTCRDVYQQKQTAQAKVAKLPGYAALSPEYSDIDSTAILNQLAPQQAALIIFDYGNGDNILNGALLLYDGEVHWQSLEHFATGYRHLEAFEYHIRHTRSPIRRGDLLSDENKTDFTPKYDKEHLWDSLAQWVKNALWQPLASLTEGLESLILITQGSQSHSIPWQIGAPVAPTAIDRYPSLSLFAMDYGLLSKADCSEAQGIGIAHYHGSEHPLPFAQIEAQQLQTIYQNHAAVTEDYDYPHAENAIGTFHVAGHGLHPDEQQTVAGAGIVVGENTHWQLTQLSHSKASPQSVYLSCCVAGRSTDIAGEQYGVASVFLQKGTQEVVACQVSMEDGWSMALSLMTHTLRVEEGLNFKEALYHAQQMLVGAIPWNETARQRVISGWSVHLSTKLKQTLQAMLERPIKMRTLESTANFLESELSSEGFKHISSQLDILNIPETWYVEFAEALYLHKGQTNAEKTLSQLAQTYTDKLKPYWRKQPSPLILGSLLYTTHIYGRTQPV